MDARDTVWVLLSTLGSVVTHRRLFVNHTAFFSRVFRFCTGQQYKYCALQWEKRGTVQRTAAIVRHLRRVWSLPPLPRAGR